MELWLNTVLTASDGGDLWTDSVWMPLRRAYGFDCRGVPFMTPGFSKRILTGIANPNRQGEGRVEIWLFQKGIFSTEESTQVSAQRFENEVYLQGIRSIDAGPSEVALP